MRQVHDLLICCLDQSQAFSRSYRRVKLAFSSMKVYDSSLSHLPRTSHIPQESGIKYMFATAAFMFNCLRKKNPLH